MSKRYLIINADDFGVCQQTNEAIEQCFNEGAALTSATVMTPCEYADDALTRAKNNPKIKIGLHITTTAEWVRKWGPVAPTDQVPSLLDENGHFYATSQDFARRAKAEEVAIEMEAQYQFMVSRGVQPTHADSHMGSIYGISGPSFMKETLEFCARHKLPFRFIKNLESVDRLVADSDIKSMHQQILAYARQLDVKLIDSLYSCSVSFSELTGYEKMKENYFKIISNLPEGISEIYMHPSLEHSPIAAGYPKWQQRVWEHRLLLDDDLKRHIDKEGIVLADYQSAPFTSQSP